MRIFTLALISLILSAGTASAQCTTPGGMIATSLTLNGNCFMYVQNAIPFSSVSIFSNNGYAGQTFANGTGGLYVSRFSSITRSYETAFRPPVTDGARLSLRTRFLRRGRRA